MLFPAPGAPSTKMILRFIVQFEEILQFNGGFSSNDVINTTSQCQPNKLLINWTTLNSFLTNNGQFDDLVSGWRGPLESEEFWEFCTIPSSQVFGV